MTRRILHLMSGSIACAKATGLTSAWAKAGHEVRVALTRSAGRFVGPATLEGFTGHPALNDLFETGRVMDHINLARWADLVVAAPATSNLINKLATGIADDLVTSLWQAAWDRGLPMVLVPAMNTHMWNYPATRENVARLTGWGVHVLPTADGDLACGEHGSGRMLEVDEILERVDGLVGSSRAHGRRILLTGGGTREPIDSVRFIGNTSTGRTAARLAERLTALGHEVTWLGAESAIRPQGVAHRASYVRFEDLRAQLERLLGAEPFDAVVHAAAVSDYSVGGISGAGEGDSVPGGKLPSGQPLTIDLTPNPKLIDRLRDWAGGRPVRVVGFKLTDTADRAGRERAIRGLFERAKVDAVVHNDLGDMRDGRHPFSVHRPDGRGEPLEDVDALADWLHHWLEYDT